VQSLWKNWKKQTNKQTKKKKEKREQVFFGHEVQVNLLFHLLLSSSFFFLSVRAMKVLSLVLLVALLVCGASAWSVSLSPTYPSMAFTFTFGSFAKEKREIVRCLRN